jgi:hypothetical protein
MSWLNNPLNTYTQPDNSFFTPIWAKGLQLADDVVAATNAISALAIPEPDLSGITLSQTDPSSVSVILPTAPGTLAITPPVPGSDPDATRIIRLLDQIEAWLNARLANDTIDTAIFNRAVDRETALMLTSYDNYIDNNASNGFSAATGQDQFAFVFFEKERKAKLSEQNRDVMIFKFEADQKAIDALQVLESNALNFFNSQEDVMVKRVGIFNDINRIAISLYQAEVQAYETTGRMKIEEVRLLTDKINSINALNSNLTNLALEKAKILNTYYLGRYQNLAEAQKAIGATLGQLTATMFNTISYSQSWSQDIRWSGSESVSD